MNRGAVAAASNVVVSGAITELDDRLSAVEKSATRSDAREQRIPADDVYSDGGRPSASSVPQGSRIWNSDDNAPNWSDGANWRDASGGLT